MTKKLQVSLTKTWINICLISFYTTALLFFWINKPWVNSLYGPELKYLVHYTVNLYCSVQTLSPFSSSYKTAPKNFTFEHRRKQRRWSNMTLDSCVSWWKSSSAEGGNQLLAPPTMCLGGKKITAAEKSLLLVPSVTSGRALDTSVSLNASSRRLQTQG